MHPHHTYLVKIAYSRSQENFKISFSAKEHVGPYLLRAHVAIFPSTPSTEAPRQKKILQKSSMIHSKSMIIYMII